VLRIRMRQGTESIGGEVHSGKAIRRLDVRTLLTAPYPSDDSYREQKGRFKSFPIQYDGHLLTVMRYVKRNPVRANFIDLAEDWQWSSAYVRLGLESKTAHAENKSMRPDPFFPCPFFASIGLLRPRASPSEPPWFRAFALRAHTTQRGCAKRPRAANRRRGGKLSYPV